ncbi:M20 family metallopeptidase [Bradyrhizobium sp. CCBAU 53421]|uniref:M20 family metallopeptidase n=1 Tax=Bradyrhizobium sp. CCBAU 53421 TaxID=1325120 RepID=UPI00188C983D|nr:M20 family metallopeptidase [Bradyrhizobium sp. CCBAU 53421]
MTLCSVELARKLIQFPSLNPPGDERACIEFLAELLSRAGLEVETHDFVPGRPSIVARLRGDSDLAPLVFSGHVDVVALGDKPWTVPPFAAEIRDGKLFGRGASDMKGGVAAFVAATIAESKGKVPLKRGITLVITAAEETGCEGAFHLAKRGVLGSAELLIVAEPTSNLPIIAHKGSLRVRITAKGKTVHSSMPELGDNAIYTIAEWIRRIEAHKFPIEPHPLLGHVTSSVTTVSGGQSINSVPDAACFTVDFRTIPAYGHPELLADIQRLCGDEARIEVITDFKGFATEPDDPSILPLIQILESRSRTAPKPAGAPYFTDASALVPGFNDVATVVIGPGEAAQCHRTDEFCHVSKIEDAFEIYSSLIRRLCG